jgi:hypothetical protein
LSVSRWHGPVALGVLLGLAAWLLTGEPGPGAFVALVVAAAAGIISRTRTIAGTGPYYQLGGFVLFVLFLTMKFGGGRGGPTAWHDLEPEFTTDRRPPGLERQPQVHLIRRTSKFSIKPYRYRRVFVALGRDGIDVRPSWPQTLVYRSLHIPLQRLAGCRTDHYMFAGHTLLEVQYPMVDVGLPDADGRVLAWCRENGVGNEEGSTGDAGSRLSRPA